MKTILKIIAIAFAAIISIAILAIVILNCGTASSIAESILKMKTGCDAKIYGLQITPSKHFLALNCSVDSLYLENSADSIDVRIRDIKGNAEIKRQGTFADCSMGRSFLRFGSNRVILGKTDISGNFKSKSSYTASVNVAESKFISTMFPLLSRLNAFSIDLDEDKAYLNELSLNSGTSDLSISGAASNLDDYLKGKSDLEIVFDIKSDNLNINEIAAAAMHGFKDARTHYSPADEENEDFIIKGKYVNYPFKIILIPLVLPERVQISADLNMGKVRVAVVKIDKATVHLDVKDKIARISDMKVKSNVGDIDATAFYASGREDKNYVGLDLNVDNINARRVIPLLPPSKNLTPTLSSLDGIFSCKATLTTQVDNMMIPNINSLTGVINFKGQEMNVTDAGNLRKYTSMLMFRNKNIGEIDDVNMYSIISDSKIKVFPMTLHVDRYLLTLAGSHTFKNLFDYDISVLKSPLPFKFGVSLHSDGGKSKVQFKLKKATFLDDNIPSFYQEVSDAHNSLSAIIGNIMTEGGNKVNERSSKITRELFDKHKSIKAGSISDLETEFSESVKEFYLPKSGK